MEASNNKSVENGIDSKPSPAMLSPSNPFTLFILCDAYLFYLSFSVTTEYEYNFKENVFIQILIKELGIF
ncbi:hypothetical protein Avbf_10157 [Armadillidium vulgare]|nr:hypothetical protein Avbf_10157 [Armadillidium vulgare]